MNNKSNKTITNNNNDTNDETNNYNIGGASGKTISKLDKKLSHFEKQIFAQNTYPSMCGKNYEPSIFPDVPKIIVLGDIHGDYDIAIEMLKISEVIPQDGSINWIGNNTYVVQVGDQIDRCRPMHDMLCNNPKTTLNDESSDLKLLKLFTELNNQAMKFGGRVISLLGNHEILNSTGYMQYVSYKGLREFDNYKTEQGHIIQNGEEARKYAFSAGNEWGRFLGCTRYPAVIIGNHLFVHAGIVNGLIEELGIKGTQDLETINIAIKMWLLGLLNKKYIKTILKSSNTSMFWTRILGKIPPNVPLSNPACLSHIGSVLNLFRVSNIIIGHTPQSFEFSDNINATCDGHVWRVDNGSSAAFHKFDKEYMMSGKSTYARRAQILIIEKVMTESNINVIYSIKDKSGIVTSYKQQCLKDVKTGQIICK